MNIGIIGAGYVGLATAACLAEIGHHVVCADSDNRKVNLLLAGQLPIFEPHLAEIVQKNRKAGRLEIVSRTEEAVVRGRVIFICVGTPPLQGGEADLSALDSLTRAIAQHARGYKLLVGKSTVPVETGRHLQERLGRCQNSAAFQCDIASNPEFLREGSAVEDFLHPDRIVVGAESSQAVELLQEVYRPILERSFACPLHADCARGTKVPWLVTDINTAELIKHAANSFLAMKISFINMIADLCEAVESDVSQVAQALAFDPRIGSGCLAAGVGFGGFCFPKDLQAFIRIGAKYGCDFSLLQEVEAINQRRIARYVGKVKEELSVLWGKRVGVWGLAFKPDTDDVRNAPAIEIIRRLLAEGAEIQADDPKAMEKARAEVPRVKYCPDLYRAAEGAEAILALTEWDEFRHADFRRLRALVSKPLLVDGRNMFSGPQLAAEGFRYVGIGKRPAASAVDVGS